MSIQLKGIKFSYRKRKSLETRSTKTKNQVDFKGKRNFVGVYYYHMS